MSQWYYGTPGDNPSELTPKETNGPHTKADIVYLITEGHILETYLVKSDAWDLWKRVGDIPESVWKEGEPAPVAKAPAPVAEAPAPVAEAPAPVVEAPAPVAEAPAPVAEAPAPVAEAPAPVPEAPVYIPEKAEPPTEQPSTESESSDFIPLATPPGDENEVDAPGPGQPAPNGAPSPAPPPKEPRAAQVLSRFQRDHARCPDCTHTVSLWALSCPRCGRPTPGSQFAPPNAPSERAFRGSIYVWAGQITISMLFLSGFLMSTAEVDHNARSGALISAIALSVIMILRAALLVFYTQRSEIIRKTGIVLSGLNIAHNIRSFMASMLVLENGLKAPEWAANAVIIVANSWVPYEAATSIAGLVASTCFILFAIKAKIAFPGKDPVLAFFRGDRA